MGSGEHNRDDLVDDFRDDAGVVGGDDGDCGAQLNSVSCSICLEAITDNGDRSWAKLQCCHRFHLDCIGSAFNAKGAMQCPNCRKTEKGQWLYSNGSRSFPEFTIEDPTYDEDLYDLSYTEMPFGVHWCPFGGVARLPPPFMDGEFSPGSYHDLSRHHAVFPEQATSPSAATHSCPYLAFLGPIHPSSSNSIGNVPDSSNFGDPLNGPTVYGEVFSSYAFPSMGHHYPNWNHGFSGVAAVQPQRNHFGVPGSASILHPWAGHRSDALSVGYPSSQARSQDRAQALQAYYQLRQPQQPSRSPPPPPPRPTRTTAQSVPAASPSDQSVGILSWDPRSGRPNPSRLWDRDHRSIINQVDSDGAEAGRLGSRRFRQRRSSPNRSSPSRP